LYLTRKNKGKKEEEEEEKRKAGRLINLKKKEKGIN